MSEKAKKLIRENQEKHARGKDASKLDLGKCDLEDLDKEIPELFECVWLEKLILCNEYWDHGAQWRKSENSGKWNQIHRLPDGIIYLKNLKGLYCGGFVGNIWLVNDLKYLERLTKLTYLDLEGNQISDLNSLEQLSRLTELYLSGNQVIDLKPLKNLCELTRLFLNQNQISDLKPLEKLSKLTELDLSDNQISDLKPLEKLFGLTSLNLERNQISDLKPLQKLNALSGLVLNNNQIRDLKPLEQLNELTEFLSFKNQIQDIEPILLHLKRKDFAYNISNNPVVNPPFEIVEQGRKAIIKFFEESTTEGTERHYEAKMLVIGEGGAGKTSLIKKLLNENDELPEESATTKGIEIHRLNYDLSENKKMQVNVWDFGGQEIYHATHQFFLTHRSLYVLVDDTRKDDKNLNDASFNYWLQTAELFGGDSPLLILQNEKGNRSKDIDLAGMKGRFSNVKDKFATNLETCSKDFQSFRNKSIPYYLQQLPHVGENLPKAWLRVRKKLEEIAPASPFISLDKYFEICAAEKITDSDKALFLSQYLHDIGVFLHFQDDPLLRNIVILANDWATDAVYKVLDSEIVKGNKGRFGRKEIETIWNESRWKNKTDELLRLMEKFELAYKVDSTTELWLVPQLFPASKPDNFSWDSTANLNL